MQESRRELVDRLLTFMGELSDSGARVVAEQLLTHAIHSIWIKHPFRSFLMPDPYLLTTVAGTRSYSLPPWFGRVANRDGVIQNLTLGRSITPIEGEDLYSADASAGSVLDTQTAPPTRYMIRGMCGFNVQVPPAGVLLEAVSDNAADTDVQVVVDGIDANGQFSQVAATLNGTVAVAVGSVAWTKGQNFSKSWPQTTGAPTSAQTLSGALGYTSSRGTVKLRNATDHTTVYQTLLPHESLREQWTLTFYRTPDGVYSIAIPTLRLPRRLLNDADPIPTMWGPAIFVEARRQYQINTGELSPAAFGTSWASSQGMSPELIDLIAWDNEQRAGGRSYSEAFGGMR